MWQTKQFKTRAAMLKWIAANQHRVQYREVFINNAYGVEYRKLRFVY